MKTDKPKPEFVKIITYVPITHSAKVRQAIGEAGAGAIGNYTFCSFSSRGIGRFVPNSKAHPFLGKSGKLEEVEEEKIEVICEKSKVREIIAALRRAHPYEEPAYEILGLVNENDF